MADSQDPNERKGRELIAEAEKKAKASSGLFSRLFASGSTAKEDAAELYVRAANCFKMAKAWSQAGDAFCSAARMRLECSSRHDAATSYVDAGNCYRKAVPNEAITSLQKAVEIYTDMGRFTIAAKHHITMAEIYEAELTDVEQAVKNYERAADYYKGEESNSSANKCLLKVANFCVQLEQYSKARDIYDQLGCVAIDSSLLKYSAKEYFFKAVLCILCKDRDTEDARTRMGKYESLFPAFADAREYKLLQKLMDALDDADEDSYSAAVAEYDSISRIDTWLTTVLLKIKKGINSDDTL